MFFNIKHSLGTPIVSIVGIVAMGIWRPPPANPDTAGIEERGEPAGTAPSIFPVAGRLRPVLLTTELPREPTMLSRNARVR